MGSTFGGTYHLIGGSMEGISPPEPEQARGVYSSAKDDESAMSNGEYLATLNHQQVGGVRGVWLQESHVNLVAMMMVP